MKSYKNWKLINESLMPLGIAKTQSIADPISNIPTIEEAKKKEDEEHACKCSKNMKDEGKKKKKKMDDEALMLKKKKKPEDDDMDDDVEDDDAEEGDEEGDDIDDEKDDDMGDDDEEGDEEDGEEDDEEGDDEEGDDDEEEKKKYGFMKKMKKMKKKMKKMKEEAELFEKSISEYPDLPQDHSQDNDKEFFASLARQFGKPFERFKSGLSEDLLIPLNDPNAPAVEPTAGTVGFAPQARIGELGSYAESTEFKTLCKYLGESAAHKLMKKSK